MVNVTGKTNKKTIIFQSIESKEFIDALIDDQSKRTGISIMRLIENALIDSFGFENPQLNEWCCGYCRVDATTSYTSLLPFLKTNADIFAFYKIICQTLGIGLVNAYIDFIPNNTNDNIDDNQFVENEFLSFDDKTLRENMDGFLYVNSALLNANPIRIKNIVGLLLHIYGHGGGR